jgi:hypothetical protein
MKGPLPDLAYLKPESFLNQSLLFPAKLGKILKLLKNEKGPEGQGMGHEP